MTREEVKAYKKAWYQAHKKEVKDRVKTYYQAHREEVKNYKKAWRQEHRESHREESSSYNRDYRKRDVNSFGKTKNLIRAQSNQYLNNHGTKKPGYEIHHCFTYDDPKKFIYCSHETHQLIHSYLREHNIKADTDHYEQIKHLLDDTVILYGIE